MERKIKTFGSFSNGIPYNRYGRGERPLLILQGLTFDNTPKAGTPLMFYKFLKQDFSVFVLLRKPGMPPGYSLQEMADDYAAVIKQEFNVAVDVLGVSTGGSIAQHLAANHPDLVRSLIIHSSAHILTEEADRMQLRIGALARQGKWRDAYAELISFMNPPQGALRFLWSIFIFLVPWLMAIHPPRDGGDVAVQVEAESQHQFKERLADISATSLLIAGALDPFYTPELFRETAAGIPNAQLVIYPKMRHPAFGKEFKKDVLRFLQGN